MKTKLMNIQQDLKCNKGQYNSFGKYKYRSCEDILESVKPLLKANKCFLTLSDELVYIGERYYIKATATVTDIETGEQITNTAYAREEETKKGMDGSQITGTSSSYARKYALNGLFAIDDTKDADTDEYAVQTEGEKEIDQIKVKALLQSIANNNISEEALAGVLKEYGYDEVAKIKIKHFGEIVNKLRAIKEG